MPRSAAARTQVRELGNWEIGKGQVERHARKTLRQGHGPPAIGHVQDGERPARGGVTP